ncbi:PAS domain-containing protein [Bacillus sp. N1-1]|nr:PAS domain-containing protein [Bacillus sp. N1-1]
MMEKDLDQSKLLRNENFISEVFSAMREGVIVVNSEYNAIYINESAEEMGFPVATLLGKSLFEIFPGLSKQNSTVLNVFETGKPIKDRIQTFVTNKGERKTTVTSTYPINKNGNIIGVYEIFSDVSGLQSMSEKLNEIKKLRKDSNFNGNKHNGMASKMIGESSEMKYLKDLIAKVASSPSPILIYGETGTGKELIVQEIHEHASRHRDIPLVIQNCAAIPESLLESILFGTVKGSFTGAEDREGLFELASGGILFLDEINSMPFSLQSKLLRVLQEGKVRRVGDLKERGVEVRLVTATNVQPSELVKVGKMRADLYYRLNVLLIEVPPLRNRLEDISGLVNYFVEMFNRVLDKGVQHVEEEAMMFFYKYHWPGNIRELKNMIERGMNLTTKDYLSLNDVQPHSILSMPIKSSNDHYLKKDRIILKKEVEELESRLIQEAIKKSEGNVSRAARELDVPQQTLDKKVKKYNLQEEVAKSKTTLK